MSNHEPNAEQIVEMRIVIKRRNELTEEIAAARKVVATLPKLEEAYKESVRDILRLIEEMDCKSPGNMGWEGRITTLLGELIKD